MRRTDKGIPVLSFCLSVRNCESTLEVCLKSVRERAPQAEIVVVDNMSRDTTPDVAAKYADVLVRYRGPKDDWTVDDPWTTDMAASRQKAFELASGRWRAWVDSDDRIAGPEEAEKILKLNARWQPTASAVEKSADKPVSIEELLLQLEKQYPAADCVWAPYCYARDEKGAAYVWQERERIIKWSDPARWLWREKAHEILVPVEGYRPAMRIDFAHLLFVHEREFNDHSVKYSTDRHFAVLHKQYVEGDRTTRRCLYLAAYALTLCPEREREFIDAAHGAATTPIDRYRSLIALGQHYTRRGLFQDAREAFGAATYMRGDLPDAWLHGAEAWVKVEDWPLAAEWFEKGIACPSGAVESYINPRSHVIKYPTILSEVYEKIGGLLRKSGDHGRAVLYYRNAVASMEKVEKNPAIGEDLREAACRRIRVHNELLSEENAVALGNLAKYLINNDEPKKALELLRSVPWNLQDHPIVIDLEKRLAPVARHLSHSDAYLDFYAADLETGYVQSPDAWLDPSVGSLARVRWIADWLNTYAPNATVLDVGCFDGIIGIPLLLLCPGIKYVGVDIYEKSVRKFTERLKERGLDDRAKVFRLDRIEDLRQVCQAPFDVAMWFEVIEHVPDPAQEMRSILQHVRPGGQIFVTTPWGSFDAGHPPDKTDHGTPRDSRGHVRAMTPRDVVEVFERAGVEVEDLEKHQVPVDTLGDGLHARGSFRKPSAAGLSAIFAVPGALWDWNGRSLHAGGMGASEKSIVQIGEALAQDYRTVEVYGPVPRPDVYRGVRYWPKEQLRHVKEGKVIVSRSPGYGKRLDETVLKTPLKKILWLQDAYYPDLTPEAAAHYEKIVVVSEWHRDAMHELHGVPLEKMEVIYNPVDPRLYTVADKPTRKRDHFVYASSPDRALVPLLKLWPRIRAALPEATLEIFYGFRGAQRLSFGSDANWTKRYEECRREFEELRYQPGITVRDMVDPVSLSRSFLSAGVWAYPVIDFNETCCTNALEARAAGCVPVAPPLAGLQETARCPQSFLTPFATVSGWEDAFLEAVVMATHVSDQDRATMAAEAMMRYSIAAVLPKWKELLQ